MPNLSNIQGPIMLIAPGRSGTSLVASIFEHHPECAYVGETANLIFGSWQAVEMSIGVIPPLLENDRWISDDERSGRVVRQTFLTCMPDHQKYWFHKPIGIPVALSSRFDENHWSDAAQWYWKVLQQSFPRARYLTILRNPFDIVLSTKARWGYGEDDIWWALGYMAFLLTHPGAPVIHALHYEKLVQCPRETTEKMFEFLEIPFAEEVLEAFTQIHAPSPGRETLDPEALTRQDEWPQLTPSKAAKKYLGPIWEMCNRFDYKFTLPEHFRHQLPDTHDQTAQRASESSSSEQQLEALKKTITALNKQIENLHLRYAQEAQTKERDFYKTWKEQQDWIAQLEEGKAWLEEQCANWQKIAQEYEQALKNNRLKQAKK